MVPRLEIETSFDPSLWNYPLHCKTSEENKTKKYREIYVAFFSKI